MLCHQDTTSIILKAKLNAHNSLVIITVFRTVWLNVILSGNNLFSRTTNYPLEQQVILSKQLILSIELNKQQVILSK